MLLRLLKTNLAVALVMAMLLTFIPFHQAMAAVVQVSVVNPTPEVAPNAVFTVNIAIGTVNKLKIWDFRIEYDPQVLQVNGAEGSQTGVTSGLVGTTAIPVELWNFEPEGTPGMVYFQGQMDSSITGTGYLARIAFKAIGAAGTSSEIKIIDAYLADENDVAINPVPTHAEVKIVAPRPTTTTPSPSASKAASPTTTTPRAATTTPGTNATTATPGKTTSPSASATASAATTATPTGTPARSSEPPAPSNTRITIAAPPSVPAGKDFVIRIDISKAVKLGSYHFIMEYNPDILEVARASEGLIGSTKIDIKDWALPPDSEGQVEVNGTVAGAKSISGSGYLAKIHCRMIGSAGDKSDLSFTEIELFDLEGEPLDIQQTVNGAVSTEASKASITVPKEVPPDGEFEARIDITELIDLASYSVKFTYSSSVIEILGVNPGLVGEIEVPVDEWDEVPTEKKGAKQLVLSGSLGDEGGISGSGYLATVQCKVIGRLGQKCTFTIDSVELVDIDGSAMLQSEPENGSITIANPSFFANKLMLILVIVGGLIVIGIIVFVVLRILRRRRGLPPGGPARPQRTRGGPRTDAPEDLLDVMRNRVSQLPSRKDRKK